MGRVSRALRVIDERATGAVFSADRRYRYVLWRTWDRGGPLCNFLMLNPSHADETRDDATIARCRRRVERWGFGGVVVTNLFARCATDPADLLAAEAPVGPSNDAFLAAAARAAALVVCAWGNHGTHRGRAGAVLRVLARCGVTPHCVALTQSGQPGHPLYLPYGLPAVPLLTATARRQTAASRR